LRVKSPPANRTRTGPGPASQPVPPTASGPPGIATRRPRRRPVPAPPV